MSKITAGTLVRLSYRGKEAPDLRAIPRDDIGLVLGHFVVKNHLGYPVGVPVYRVRWMNGYYPEHQCYRNEIKFASNKQRQLNQKRLKNVT